MFDYIIIGLIAASITSIRCIPQLYHMIKRKSTKDISYLFLFVQIIECIMWFTYGILDESLPVMISSGVPFIITILMIFTKIKYDNNTNNI